MGYVNKICLSATDPNNDGQYTPVTTHLIEPTLYFDTTYDNLNNNYILSNKGDFIPVDGVVILIKINNPNSIALTTTLEDHNIYLMNGTTTDTAISFNTNTIYNLLYDLGYWYLINNSVSCIGLSSTNNDNEYPILLKHSSNTDNETNVVNFINDTDNKITANPYTGTITAKLFSGAFTGTATTATKLASAVSLWGNSFDGSTDINNIIYFKHSGVTIDTSSNNGNTTSGALYRGISMKDSADYMYGECYAAVNTNGTVRTYLNSRNKKTDGTVVSNSLLVGVQKDGTRYYTVTDAAAFRSAISAPSITGENASGTWGIDISGAANSALAVSRTNTTLNATKAKNNLSSAMDQNVIWMGDTNNAGVARVNVYAYADTDKKIGLRLQARNYNSSTSAWGGYGGISIWANNDGTFTYNVSSSANFRSAIGAGTSNLTIGTTSTTAAAGNHTHSYLPLSGGQLTGNVFLMDSDLVKGTAPSETTYTRCIYFLDKNNTTASTRAGRIGTWVTAAKVVSTRIYAYDWTKDSTTSGYFAAGYDTANSVARTYTNCKVYGAVWNDYAEYRQGDIIEGGYCVTETPSGVMTKSTERLLPGCRVTSDTFGFAIGETKECKTPIAVSGRVLVYTARPREEFPLGAAVCSAPDGKVDLMTREEIKEYPERIVGTVSEIPDYDIWYGGISGLPEEETPTPVMVNGRIWIYIK